VKFFHRPSTTNKTNRRVTALCLDDVIFWSLLGIVCGKRSATELARVMQIQDYVIKTTARLAVNEEIK
jgi:hypothetical protein